MEVRAGHPLCVAPASAAAPLTGEIGSAMATLQVTPIGVGIKNVLIATDFSRCSRSALDFGLQLAKTYKARAHVAYVLPSADFLLSGPEVYVSAQDAARRDLKQLQADIEQSYSCRMGEDFQIYLLEGEVTRSILEFVRQWDIDLIVLGTHGRGGLGKAFLGSVAEQVFRHTPIPVLTVGPEACEQPLHCHPREIIVPADFTPPSRRAVQYAVALAREHHSNLTLLHVVNPKQLEHVPDRAAAERGLTRRLSELVDNGEGMPCAIRLEVGRISETILEVARTQSADLLVMGVRPSSGVLDRLVIPHAYEVIRGAPCPVLTLRGATESID